MKITKNDERKINNYLLNRNDSLNIYFLSDNRNKCQEASKLNYRGIISTSADKSLTFLKNKTAYELKKYNLIVVSNSEYNIYYNEQLRTLTKKLAIENNQNMMAVYHYFVDYQNDDEIIFYFEMPNFEEINKIEINKHDFNVSKLFDLAAYKYDNNIKSKSLNKTLTLKRY